MRILFKQIQKTFLKNILLIFGLSSLLTTLSFVVSSSVQLSESFNTSLYELNKKGNKSSIISSKPGDFGFLDFDYKEDLSNPVNVFTSSISLQPDKAKPNTFKRVDNTLFPYGYNQFYDKDKKEWLRKDLNINSGINFDYSKPEGSQVSFDTFAEKKIWDTNFGISLTDEGGSNVFKKAYSISLVDSSGDVLLNPQNLLFNNAGYPVNFFKNGALDYNSTIQYSLATISSSASSLKNNGFEDPNTAFNRFNIPWILSPFSSIYNAKNTHNIDVSNHKYWDKEGGTFPHYTLSQYKKDVEVIPWAFDINMDNSHGPIKEFIKQNPDLLEDSFNQIFPGFSTGTPISGETGKKITSSITFDKTKNQILLSVPDTVFYDPTIAIPEGEQILKNKNLFIENFNNYLSINIKSSLYNIFNSKFKLELSKKNIGLSQENEFFYKESKTNQEYLFVKKSDNKINNIVISEGINIEQELDIEELFKELNNKIGNMPTKKVFYALKKLVHLFPSNQIPSKPTSPQSNIIDTDYSWYQLYLYCFNTIIREMKNSPDDLITQDIYSLPEFKLFIKLMNQFRIENNNFINVYYSLKSSFSTLSKVSYATIEIPNNKYVVINESYAILNNKKSLPININDDIYNLWKDKLYLIDKLPSYEEKESTFYEWIIELTKTQPKKLILSKKIINVLFKDYPNFYNIWIEHLPSNYKIPYNNYYYLICGLGLSPDYAFPIINPVTPIPNPSNQVIIYLNDLAFDFLKLNNSDITSYYAYNSYDKIDKNVIAEINKTVYYLTKTNFIKPNLLWDSKNLQVIWLRSFFPKQITDLILIITIVASIVLILLSLFIIYLLLKSLIKNLLEPIAICLANGISLKKVIFASLINIGIISAITTIIGYVISFLTQGIFLSIFSSVWFLAPNILPFSPLILSLMFLFIFLFFGVIFVIILYSKFKQPIPDILANKEELKLNKFTNLLRASRLPINIKLSFGFASTKINRLFLLTILSSFSLGAVVSLSMIQEKFSTSRLLTKESQNYNNQYNFSNVKESTGLYKTQKYEELGFGDKSMGINSIHNYPWSPYKSENNIDLTIKEVIPQTQKLKVKTYDDGLTRELTNMVLPSYGIYQQLLEGNPNLFFNSALSVFLLDVKINFMGLDIPIWNYVEKFFPTWITNQLISQVDKFKKYIMEYYGEWYYQFTDAPTHQIAIENNNVDPLSLSLNDIQHDSSGIYYATSIINDKLVYSKPYFVWVDSKQIYYKDGIRRKVEKSGSNIELVLQKDEFSKNNNSYMAEPNNQITWNFISAYNTIPNLNGEKISTSKGTNPLTIRLNDKFLDFVTTIYGNPIVSAQDSKISFGIIPFDEKTDEKFTNINGYITSIKDLFQNDIIYNKPINILGLKNNSPFIKLTKDGEDLYGLLQKNKIYTNNTYDIIINHGASIEFNLKVGSKFNIDIKNNVLLDSYNIMNQFIPLDNSIINNKYTFNVVGINDDSFGSKFYIDIDTANKIISLDKITTMTNITPTIKRESLPLNTPFNGIFSNSLNPIIGNSSIPFYTNIGLWNTLENINDLKSFPLKQPFEIITTSDPKIIKLMSNKIKIIDNSFNNSDEVVDGKNLRDRVVEYLFANNSTGTFTRSISVAQGNSLLIVAVNSIIPSDTIDNVFSIISTLSTTIMIIGVSIIIPLLFIIIFITSTSLLNDLLKNITLLKVLGYSKKNIIITLALMYLPVIIITLILACTIMFAISYGLQFLVFNITSIYISQSVNLPIYFMGAGIIILIFLACIYAMSVTLKKKKFIESIKF